jgi:hypothetical protein
VEAPAIEFSSLGLGLGPFNTVNHSFGMLPTGASDNNDLVDIVDFSQFRSVFGQINQTCGTGNPVVSPCANYDASGPVDIVDLSLLRSNYEKSGPIPVP